MGLLMPDWARGLRATATPRPAEAADVAADAPGGVVLHTRPRRNPSASEPRRRW
jgi:hypothetical protein